MGGAPLTTWLNNVYIAWNSSDTGHWNVLFLKSSDNGQTFATNIMLSPPLLLLYSDPLDAYDYKNKVNHGCRIPQQELLPRDYVQEMILEVLTRTRANSSGSLDNL
jgi:hypothetical protein